MGRSPVPKWGLLREGSNQQGIEGDMDPKTEETKLKVEVETKRKVEGRKNLRQTQSDPGEKSPSRALTPTKRDSQSEVTEGPQGDEEDPGRNSSATTGSFEKVEANDSYDDNPDRIPDSQFIAHPVDAPVFRGDDAERGGSRSLKVAGRRCKSPRTHSPLRDGPKAEHVVQEDPAVNHEGENGTGEAVDSPGEAGSTRVNDGLSAGVGPGLAKLVEQYRRLGGGDSGEERRCAGTAWDAGGACDGAVVAHKLS